MGTKKSTGEHIKSWAGIFMALEVICSIPVAIISGMFIANAMQSEGVGWFLGLFTLVVCIFSSLFSYRLLTGFGEMVEDTMKIKKLLIEIRNQGNRTAEHSESQTHTRA
jgi:hypothetical protein